MVKSTFLGLAPNGVGMFRTLKIAQRVMQYGLVCQAWRSQRPRQAHQRHRRRHPHHQRDPLHKALREEARSRGIRMHFGKKLERIETSSHPRILAHFADGTSVGGLPGQGRRHPRARQIILPDGPAPHLPRRARSTVAGS
jgi:hypothetical protein